MLEDLLWRRERQPSPTPRFIPASTTPPHQPPPSPPTAAAESKSPVHTRTVELVEPDNAADLLALPLLTIRRLCLTPYGSQFVKNILEDCRSEEQMAFLDQIAPFIVELCTSEHGHQVLSRLMKVMRRKTVVAKMIGHLLPEFSTNLVNLASHPHGSWILIKLLLHRQGDWRLSERILEDIFRQQYTIAATDAGMKLIHAFLRQTKRRVEMEKYAGLAVERERDLVQVLPSHEASHSGLQMLRNERREILLLYLECPWPSVRDTVGTKLISLLRRFSYAFLVSDGAGVVKALVRAGFTHEVRNLISHFGGTQPK